MNYRIITYVIGWVLNLEAICMTLPAVTGLIYGEKTWTSFLITGLISALAGTLLVVRRPEKPHFFMKEGCDGKKNNHSNNHYIFFSTSKDCLCNRQY